MRKYDAVVIGAGNGGLVAAIRLLQGGARVIVVEKHNIPGGFATSFRRGRFEFEASLHELNDFGTAENAGDVRVLFDELGVDFSYKDTFKPSALLLLSGIYDPYRSIDTGFPFIKTYVSAFAGETYKKLKAHFDGDERRLTSPEFYADGDFPPSFIVASGMDRLLSESLSLYTKLKSSGVPCAYFVCKGINGMHAASLDSVHGKYGKECFARAVTFMQEALAKAFTDGANAA